MPGRFVLTGVVSFALLASASCSKTANTSPPTELFGDPPVIEQVNFQTPPVTVSCDFTEAVDNYLQVGLGADISATPGPLVVTTTVTQVQLAVKVSDPQSLDDILTVSASYLTDGSSEAAAKEETSMILLDDGSSFKFSALQASEAPEDCHTDMGGTLQCQLAHYQLVSNDPAPGGDGQYTRTVTIYGQTLNTTLLGKLGKDCVAMILHDAVINSRPEGYTFKIEVTDKEGNLTAWPEQQSVIAPDTEQDCTGDPCLCCYLKDSSDYEAKCSGLPGMAGPGLPEGFCMTF